MAVATQKSSWEIRKLLECMRFAAQRGQSVLAAVEPQHREWLFPLCMTECEPLCCAEKILYFLQRGHKLAHGDGDAFSAIVPLMNFWIASFGGGDHCHFADQCSKIVRMDFSAQLHLLQSFK